MFVGMQRRTFVTSCAALGAASLLPAGANAREVKPSRATLESLLVPVRTHLREHGIEDRFEEDELRCYLECGIDMANAVAQLEDGGPIAEVRGDQIESALDRWSFDAWLGMVQWATLVHATFSLSLNWDSEGRMLPGRDAEAQALTEKAERMYEACEEWFFHEVERRYEIATGVEGRGGALAM